MQPILKRIDHAVRHVAAMGDAIDETATLLTVPPIDYSPSDLLGDLWSNPGGVLQVGGSADPDEYPAVEPRGRFPAAPGPPRGRVAIIGCSAGGYIARMYLSRRAYAGASYQGSELVHSLVTLGTPHFAGQGIPFENVRWVNREAPPDQVRMLAVGSTGTPGTH